MKTKTKMMNNKPRQNHKYILPFLLLTSPAIYNIITIKIPPINPATATGPLLLLAAPSY